jgi:PAS domain S-box-containing protein
VTPAQQLMRDCGLLYRNYPVVAVVLTATCCLSVGLMALGIRRRAARGGREFTLAMAAVAVWSIGYYFELVLPSAQMRFAAAQVEYVGIVSLPPLWLLLAAGYTKRIDLHRPLRAALLFAVPAVTLALAATSRWHGLLWSGVWMDDSISPRILRFVHGPYFWVNITSAYLMLVTGTALFIWHLAASRPARRSVSVAMIVAAAAPLAGNLLYVSGLNPQPRFDTTPFSFVVSGCAVAWVLFRHGFLDIVPFARNRVVETMRDPVVVVDAAGRIVDANPAACALAGPARAPVGAPAALLLPGWREGDASAPFPADISLEGPSGKRVFTADASEIRDRKGRPVGRVVVLHDVTERQRMEQVLRASEEKYRRLVEGIDQVIFSVDGNGCFTYVSPVITRMSGYTPGEIVGLPFSRFVHPEDIPLVARNIAARYRGEPGQNEFRVLDKNGRVLSVRTSSSPVLEGGVAVGLTGIMTDVTEQRQLAAQLHQSQKMEAVGRLAGGVAHDFNNLLSAITGFTELLLLKETLDSESRDLLTELRKSIERGAGLVRQLLAFGRKQVLQPSLFGLDEMARGLQKMLARLIGGNVTLALDLDPDPCVVRADRGQLELAVVNLAVNARDAMPGGGTLTLATRAVPGGGARLRVSDTGCGMSDTVKSHLFEPFFTTKAPGSGTGLGLPAVYGIVKQSGATIAVESSPGAGTAVEILFPALPDGGEGAAQA